MYRVTRPPLLALNIFYSPYPRSVDFNYSFAFKKCFLKIVDCYTTYIFTRPHRNGINGCQQVSVGYCIMIKQQLFTIFKFSYVLCRIHLYLTYETQIRELQCPFHKITLEAYQTQLKYYVRIANHLVKIGGNIISHVRKEAPSVPRTLNRRLITQLVNLQNSF